MPLVAPMTSTRLHGNRYVDVDVGMKSLVTGG